MRPLVGIAVIAVLLGACTTTTEKGTVGVERRQFLLVSSAQMDQSAALDETEADRIGVELAARAGYDPRAANSLWQKMAQIAGGGGTPTLLSTHPSNEDRIKDLQVFSQRVLALYEQARVEK